MKTIKDCKSRDHWQDDIPDESWLVLYGRWNDTEKNFTREANYMCLYDDLKRLGKKGEDWNTAEFDHNEDGWGTFLVINPERKELVEFGNDREEELENDELITDAEDYFEELESKEHEEHSNKFNQYVNFHDGCSYCQSEFDDHKSEHKTKIDADCRFCQERMSLRYLDTVNLPQLDHVREPNESALFTLTGFVGIASRWGARFSLEPFAQVPLPFKGDVDDLRAEIQRQITQ